MEFRRVSEIPGRKSRTIKRYKRCKNEKRLLAFCHTHMARAEIVNWENEFASAKSMYESLHKSLDSFRYIPVRVIYRKTENKVYLERTDMERIYD
jgi:hypothetical protein